MRLLLIVSVCCVSGSTFAIDPSGSERVAETVTDLRDQSEATDSPVRATDAEFREAVEAALRQDATQRDQGHAVVEDPLRIGNRASQQSRGTQEGYFPPQREAMERELKAASQQAERVQRQLNESWRQRQPSNQPHQASAWSNQRWSPDAQVPVNSNWPQPPPVNRFPTSQPTPWGATPTPFAAPQPPFPAPPQRGLLDTAFELERLAHELELSGKAAESDLLRQTAMDLRKRSRRGTAELKKPDQLSRGRGGRYRGRRGGGVQGGPIEPPPRPTPRQEERDS